MISIDGPNLIITLPSATPTIDVTVDLYSDWKEWVKVGDNAKYPKAFDTTGGDPTTATQVLGRYYFLRNDLGWRIRGPEEDATIVIEGNLFGRDPALPIIVPTIGAYTQNLQQVVSSLALVETVSTGSGLSPTEATELNELWKIAGLDVSDPMTVTQSQRKVSSNDIDLAVTGDGITTTTVTRQP